MDNKVPSFDKVPDPKKPIQPAPLAEFDVKTDALISQASQHPPMQTAKRSKKGLWATLLTLLVLALAAAAGYFYWQTMEIQKQADDAHVQLQAANVANEKLKQAADSAAQDTPKELTAAEQKAADKMAITDVVTAKLHAVTKDKDVKLKIDVMKQDDEFAYVNAGPESGGGAAYILKKVEDQWTIVFSGQEKPSQTEIDAYSIPAEFQSGQ